MADSQVLLTIAAEVHSIYEGVTVLLVMVGFLAVILALFGTTHRRN